MLESIFPSISSVLCISSIGLLFGLILSAAKLKLKVEIDPRFEDLLASLPGANCGACSQPGCSGYALKIIEQGIPINLCPVGGQETIEKMGAIMGIKAEMQKPGKARIHCQGGKEDAISEFVYDGPQSCLAAQQIMNGFKVCQFGCLGLGDCVRSCSFGAIHLNDSNIPIVDWEKCTGCGNCVDACPRGIIDVIDEDIDVYVLCQNKEKAPLMKKGCTVGCIGCKKCIKACKEVFTSNSDIETAIEVMDFLAVINYEKCINCGKCAEVCPQKVIEFKKQPVTAN